MMRIFMIQVHDPVIHLEVDEDFLFACLKACFRLSLSTRNKKKRTITSKKHAYRPETSYVLYYSLKE